MYYLHAIKYNKSDQEFSKTTERKLHIAAIVYPLATSVLFLLTKNINAFPDGHLCFIFEEPYGCTDNDDVDCVRGEHAFLLVTFLSFLPVMLVCGGMTYSLGSLCQYVLKQEKRNNQRLRQSMAIPGTFNSRTATALRNARENENSHNGRVSIGSSESRRRLSLASMIGFVRRNSCDENIAVPGRSLSRASSEISSRSRRRFSLLAGRRNSAMSDGNTELDNGNSDRSDSGRMSSLAPTARLGRLGSNINSNTTSPSTGITSRDENTGLRINERIPHSLSVVSNVTSLRSSITSFRGSCRDPISIEENGNTNSNASHNASINTNTNVNVAALRSSVSSLRTTRPGRMNTTPNNSTTNTNSRRGSVFSYRSSLAAMRNTSASGAASMYVTRGEKIAQRRRQQTMIQAVLYVGCYFFIYTLPLISHFAFYERGVTQPIVLTTIEHALFPIGGMFNILIYTRPRVSTLQRRQKISWIRAFYEVIKAGGDLPKNYRRRQSRRRSSQNSSRSQSVSVSRHQRPPTPPMLRQGRLQDQAPGQGPNPNPPSRRVSFFNHPQANRRSYPYQYFHQNSSNDVPQSASEQRVSATEDNEEERSETSLEQNEIHDKFGDQNDASNISPMSPIRELQARQSSLKKSSFQPASSNRTSDDECSVVDNNVSGNGVVGGGDEDEDEFERNTNTLSAFPPQNDIEIGIMTETVDGNEHVAFTRNSDHQHQHHRLDPREFGISDEDYDVFEQFESVSNSALLENDLGFESDFVDSHSDNSRSSSRG